MTVGPTAQPASGATGDSTSVASGVGLATRAYGFFRYNMKITIGLFLVLIVVAFGYLGPFFGDLEKAEVGSVLPPGQATSAENWLGTDAQGRDMLAWLIDATPDSLRVGVMAGALGVMIGASVGFIAGYYGGWIDTFLRTITDIAMAIPGLLVLIVLASLRQEGMTLELMAFLIALLSWMGAARVIRAQVLS
ncbi:MAG: ABC transporter permease, partial [Chloroflexi bacterium]|nr:ABC transporter permease [Chloroflexota bacterium]